MAESGMAMAAQSAPIDMLVAAIKLGQTEAAGDCKEGMLRRPQLPSARKFKQHPGAAGQLILYFSDIEMNLGDQGSM